MMKTNKLREILNNNQPSIATRILSAWPTITEAVASTGKFDYIEFVAEYAPFSMRIWRISAVLRSCTIFPR